MMLFALGFFVASLFAMWTYNTDFDCVEKTAQKPDVKVFTLLPSDPFVIGDGERAYLLEPHTILDAVRKVEGVPSYGVMTLARRYGSHRVVPEALGRAEAAKIMHKMYRRWRAQGRPGDFLDYMHKRYAPVGASNDPTGLNRHWRRNLERYMEARR
jgi:hypothetical protein